MAPEIPPYKIGTERRSEAAHGFGLFFFVLFISVIAGILAFAVIDGSGDDARKESDRDIQNCIDQKGTVIVGSNNWFKECRIQP